MNALAMQVCALVELFAFVRGPRLLGRSDELEHGALRRCSPARKLEPSCLVDHAIVPAANANRNADCKRTRASRPGHLDPGEGRGADLGHERAAIEICETRPAPPETDEQKRGSEPDRSAPTANDAERRKQDGSSSQQPGVGSNHERARAAGAEGANEEVRRRNASQKRHRSTRGFSSARRVGPIPGTASSSSIVWKAPCSVL